MMKKYDWEAPENVKREYRGDIMVIRLCDHSQKGLIKLIDTLINRIYSIGFEHGIQYVRDNPDMMAGPGRECGV